MRGTPHEPVSPGNAVAETLRGLPLRLLPVIYSTATHAPKWGKITLRTSACDRGTRRRTMPDLMLEKRYQIMLTRQRRTDYPVGPRRRRSLRTVRAHPSDAMPRG